MMKSSKEIVEELKMYDLVALWFCEPSEDMYGTIEVTEDVEVRVFDSGYVKVIRGVDVYDDQPETIPHLVNVIKEAITDGEITC